MLNPNPVAFSNVFQAIRNFDTLDHKAILERMCDEGHLAEFQAAGDSLNWPTITPAPTIPSYMLKVVEHINDRSRHDCGDRVAAIKLIRTETSMGLKEAKDALDLACPRDPEGTTCNPALQSVHWAEVFINAGLRSKLLPMPVKTMSTNPRELTAYIVIFNDFGGKASVHGTFQLRSDAEDALDVVQRSYSNGYIHQTFIALHDPA